MNRHKQFLAGVFVLLLGAMLLQSCKHDPEGIDQLPLMFYNTDVAPILSSCSSCHEHQTGSDKDLTSYSAVMHYVKKEDPAGSKLYHVITAKLAPIMPPSPASPLSANERTTIYLWIEQGAPEALLDN